LLKPKKNEEIEEIDVKVETTTITTTTTTKTKTSQSKKRKTDQITPSSTALTPAQNGNFHPNGFEEDGIGHRVKRVRRNN